jgi:hypothetical protein
MALRLPASGPAPALLAALLTLLAGCDRNDAPDDVVQHPRAPEIARIMPAAEALANADLAKLDPATMNDAEIRQAIGTGPLCLFRYTSSGKPVLAVGARPSGLPLGGVAKLNGHLISLEAARTDGAAGATDSLVLTAGPIRMTVTPDRGEGSEDRNGVRRRDADMVLEVGESLKAGYRGYLGCAPQWSAGAPNR